MIGVITETLFNAIISFFLLGIATYFTFVILKVLLDVCLFAPRIVLHLRHSKGYSPGAFFEQCKNLNTVPIAWDIACAVTVTLIGIVYCLFTYIFLDGVLRILPFIALLLGVYLLNVSFGKRFVVLNKYIRLTLTLIIGCPFYLGTVFAKAIYGLVEKIWLKLKKKTDKIGK